MEPTRPAPRFDVAALLIHTLPLSKPKPAQCVLQEFEGTPSPDRGPSRPWPDQPEQ